MGVFEDFIDTLANFGRAVLAANMEAAASRERGRNPYTALGRVERDVVAEAHRKLDGLSAGLAGSWPADGDVTVFMSAAGPIRTTILSPEGDDRG